MTNGRDPDEKLVFEQNAIYFLGIINTNCLNSLEDLRK